MNYKMRLFLFAIFIKWAFTQLKPVPVIVCWTLMEQQLLTCNIRRMEISFSWDSEKSIFL